jgi:hypothetical protein
MAEKVLVGCIVAGALVYLVWQFISARRKKRCFGCQHIEYCERKDPREQNCRNQDQKKR